MSDVSCSKCGKTFSRAANLMKHQQTNKCSRSIDPQPLQPFIRNARDARAFFASAGDILRSYLNPNLFPDVAKECLVERVTGMTREQFSSFCDLLPDTARLRFLSKDNRIFLYLKKLRQGLSFESLGFDFNISAQRACEIFWDVAADHMHHDPLHPRLLAMRNPLDLLEDSVVDDPFILGVFHRLVQGKKLALLIGDHTYFYLPKSSCHQTQARTYFAHKHANVNKKMVLVNNRGHILYCGPLTGAISPVLGDGNLTALQLELESSGTIEPELLRILCSGSTDVQTVAIFDKGYNRQPCSPTNLNFVEFVLKESKGRTMLMFPAGPGDKVLSKSFKLVKNPVPAQGRPIPGKLTALEANTSRCATMFRYVVECSFAAIKHDKCINERHEPYQWLQSAGFCERSRLDVVIENSIAKYNRTHPGFESHKKLPPSWSGLSLFDYGKNFAKRVFLANELDEIEQVRFDITRIPAANSRIWTAIDPLDPKSSEFPQICIENLEELSVGPYQLKQADNYIQNIRVQEVLGSYEGESWHDFELLTSELPSHLKCWKFWQPDEPGNWSSRFGLWQPSWIFLAVIFSMHKSKTYRVILRVCETPAGNRFGFRDSGLQLLHGYYSSAKAGSRTAGCDCHVMAVLKILGCYAYDSKAYKNSGAKLRFVDSALPQGLITSLYGKAEGPGPQYQQHRAEPATSRQSSTPVGGSSNRSQPDPRRLVGLPNRGLQCYANVIAQLFFSINGEVPFILAVRADEIHNALRNLMTDMETGSASVEELLSAVRSQFPQQFAPKQQHCVNELLQCILSQVQLQPDSLSEFSLVRMCRDCLFSSQEMPHGAIDRRVLSIALQQFSNAPLSLDALYTAFVAPQNVQCPTLDCGGTCSLEVQVSHGRVTLLHIDRTGDHGQKLHTSISWSRRAGSVISLGCPFFTVLHHGNSIHEGHFTCCIFRDGVWNKLDDMNISKNWNPFVQEAASIVLVALLQV